MMVDFEIPATGGVVTDYSFQTVHVMSASNGCLYFYSYLQIVEKKNYRKIFTIFLE